jgi:hypothetical protein
MQKLRGSAVGRATWGVVSRSDFLGMEIDRLDEDDRLCESLR